MGMSDGTQPMGNYNRGPVLHEVLKGFLHFQFTVRIQCACGFIEDEDFKKGVELEDATVDLVDMLTVLLGDLPKIAGEIRGECPTSQKAWWKLHKAKRKAAKTAERQAAREAAAAEKAEKAAEKAAEQAVA